MYLRRAKVRACSGPWRLQYNLRMCRHTLNKLMKISDEEYAALDLEVDGGFAYEEYGNKIM